MQKTNYYFLRYHIATANDIESKADFIRLGLNAHATVEYNGHSFKFLDVNYIVECDIEFFTGYLVKYSQDYDEEVVDENLDQLTETNVKNKVVGKVRFLLMIESSLMAFHEQGNIINRSIFQNKFSELFEQNFSNFFVDFSTSPIIEQYSFLEEVKKFQVIKKINISLVPSNPRFSDRWKEIDERLRKNRISNYKEILENKVDGSIGLDEETESKIYMCEDGYGETSAVGLDSEGEQKTISTKSANKITKKAVPSEFVDAEQILKLLIPAIIDIVKRTKK